VGKTSITEGLIKALPPHPWTAVKISSHWHAAPSVTDAFLIQEEFPGGKGASDTARYLAAGASRAFWVQVQPHRFAEAVPSILRILQSSPFAIIESNAILHHIRPDLFIMILRCDVDEFKESARRILAHAHAIVAIDSGASLPSWKDGIRAAMDGIPIFGTKDAANLPAGLIDFIKSRLEI
jgi:hypothetical protein